MELDPYREWLQIREAERPLNYYQLLGLRGPAASPPEIEAAYGRQMHSVRRYQVGAHMEVAQRLAAEGGLTAAWWQVLGGVLDEPRSVAEIGRRMGMTRQGVQRVADLLVEHGLAEYRPNPAHRRAKLLACTEAGYWAIRRITLVQHPWANRIGAEVGTHELRSGLAATHRLVAALEAGHPTPDA